MPISRYPRPGQRLAPGCLADLLDAPVPRRLTGWTDKERIRFADLDETAWTRFGTACLALAQALVQQVQGRISPLPVAVRDRVIPHLPRDIQIEDLELETRTYNCIRKMRKYGLLRDLADLGGKTIGQLLKVGGFGAKCLVDFLTSIESILTANPQSPVPADLGVPLPPPFTATGAVRPGAGFSFHVPISALRTLRLPKLPKGVNICDLNLSTRTFNCLQGQGLHEQLHDLEDYTVGELLELPGFGEQCLSDLLRAINAFPPGAVLRRDALPEIHAASEVIVEEPRTLEEELRFLVARACNVGKPSPTDRNVLIAVRYFGLDGAPGATLDHVGQAHGLTRERVRQICQRAENAMKRWAGPMPLLEKALAIVKEHLPSPADSGEAKLQEVGVTQGRFQLEALAKAAELLGRKPPFALETVNGRRMAVVPGQEESIQNTIRIAARAIARYGVATTSEIAAMIEEHTSRATTADFVAGVLDGQPGFEWLDREAGWCFLRPTRRNRVLSRIRKILSVAESIHISELRSGIARHHAMKGYAPPRRVLLELCRRLPNCRVEGEFVRAEGENDWRNVLRGAELKMAQVLMEHGPVMPRPKFEDLCLARGVKRTTFWVYLDYSPVIERFAPGVYGLRGAKIAPGFVETLIPRNRRCTPVRLDHGWTTDRRIWIGYRLTRPMLVSGVFSVPPGLKSFLQGSFTLKAEGGIPIGTVVVNEGTGWGMGPFFLRRGGEVGDTLVILFNLEAKEARMSIGDADLIEEYRAPPSQAHDTQE